MATYFFKLILSAFLGGILGMEREHLGKVAGTRTYSLVCLGSTLFTILSLNGFGYLKGNEINYDPSRIAGQIIVGIGFLGAGLIIRHGFRVRGLTTAAGLWVSAGIGMSVGCGFYYLAIFATLLSFLLLFVVRKLNVETKLEKFFGGKETDEYK